MKNDILKLKNKEVFKLLNNWSDDMLKTTEIPVNFKFSDNLSIGRGLPQPVNKGLHLINVGIRPLSMSVFTRNQIVTDLDFLRIGAAMFHEFEHYRQITFKNIPKEILIGDLSKYKSMEYYNAVWHRMPHEIDAEYIGVMSMWEYVENT